MENRKWAWCIDIDTLKYTQTELIPDGFDL